MTKTVKRRLIAGLACAAVFAAALPAAQAHPFAESAGAQYTFMYEDTAGIEAAKGLKITLPSDGGTAEYAFSDTVDVEDMAENALTLRMLPEDPAVRDVSRMLVTFTDAIDEEQALTVSVAYGEGLWWGSSAVTVSAAYTDDLTFDIYGFGRIAGTSQNTYGKDTFTDTMEQEPYKTHGAFPLAAWDGDASGDDGDDVFSETNEGIYSVTFAYADHTVYATGKEKRLVADLTDGEFLSKSVSLLPDGETWRGLKEKYTASFAEDLFSSGKVKVRVKFMNITGDSVSFLLQSVGDKSYENLSSFTDTSGPAVAAGLESNALKGFSYTLPVPVIVDNEDGAIADYDVAVKTASGTDVPMENNAFVPQEAGEYVITYTAADSASPEPNVTVQNYVVECFSAVPEVSFAKISGEDPAAEYVTFETVPLPAYGAYSSLSFADGGAMPCDVTVVKDGVTVAAFENAGEEHAYVPETAGEYTVIYTAVNVFGLNVSKAAYAFTVEEGVSLVMEETSATARFGTAFSVPKALGVYKNRYEPAAFTVVSPSQKTVEVGGDRSFVLEETGDYVITYRHEKDGKVASATFTVSSVYTNDMLFDSSELDELQGNFTIPEYAEQAGETAVFVGSSSTSSITYKNHINVSNLTKNDNLLQFVPYADGGDYAEFAVRITLTDVHDGTNRVVITVQPHPEQGGNATWAFIHVNYDGRTLSYNTEYNEISTSSAYGCLIGNSMGGGYGTLTGVKPVSIQFDGAENAVYVTSNIDGKSDPWRVLDLDLAEHVGAGREWKGFTTGEVELSLQFENIKGMAAGMLITEIAGHSLQGVSVADDSAPVIYPEENEYFEIVGGFAPDAEVGKAYPLLGARAHDDLFGEIECAYSLKKRGGDTELYDNVKDGVFTPTETGVYDYLITAENPYGGRTTYGYSFEVKNEVAAIAVSFAEQPENVTAGAWFTLPEITAENGSGKKLLNLSAALNGAPVEITALNEIYLFEAGELVITVRAEDFLGTALANDTLTIEVSGGGKPVLHIAGMPDAALAGKTISLPDFTAVDYDAAEEGVNVYREVRVNGNRIFWGTGDETEGSLAVEVNAGGTLEITYAAGTGENGILAEQTFLIPVVEGDLSAYFLPYDGNGDYNAQRVTGEATDTDVRFTVLQDRTLKFANPLAADGLVLEFGALARYSAFGGIRVRLEDYLDPRETVELFFTTEGESSYLSVNGGAPVPVKGALDRDNGNFYIRVSAADRCVYDNLGDLVASIGTYANGLPFEGFSSGLARLSFGIEEVRTGSLRIVRIGNQSFAGGAEGFTDTTPPQIVFEHKMPFSQDALLGGEVLISAATAADVLAGEASVTVTVMNPAGVIVDGLQNAPCDETRTLVFEQYGSYYIVYTMKSGDTQETYRSIVNVRDRTAPEIAVSLTPAAEGAVGAEYAVPQAAASDNYTDAALFVFVLRPDGKLENVTAGGTYVFVQAGRHKLVYYAYDAEYNVSVQEYVIDVTEG